MRSQGCWSFFGAIYRLKSAKVGLAILRAHEQEFLLSAVADVSLFGSVARGENSTHEPLVDDAGNTVLDQRCVEVDRQAKPFVG